MSSTRNPDQTRQAILQVAMCHIHKNGFQATSIGELLKELAISKGALYHHFKSKLDLGYAVFDEVISAQFEQHWASVFNSNDPLLALISMMDSMACEMSEDELCHGCPVNNLAQEMSPIDEGFRNRIEHLIRSWQQSLATALNNGQQAGTVKNEVDCDQAAMIIIMLIQGGSSITKVSQSRVLFKQTMTHMLSYANSLRQTS